MASPFTQVRDVPVCTLLSSYACGKAVAALNSSIIGLSTPSKMFLKTSTENMYSRN